MLRYLIAGITILLCSHLILAQSNEYSKSVKDWSYTIDTTWGAGLPTEQKLEVYDRWWNKIDASWGGFPNLDISDDSVNSLRTYYRNIISNGVSRGHFRGILNKISRTLMEEHLYMVDPGIDSVFSIYYDQDGFPTFEPWNYKPGIPMLNLSFVASTYFGAGVTAIDDSIAVVYRVMPNHPMNLQPGDIILGYDGLPWRENLKNLLDQDLPIFYGGLASGSNRESQKHISTAAVGLNWGLFNTIDILKYSSGDTVHFSTSLLNNVPGLNFMTAEQLPVEGISFPNSYDNAVTWGVIKGTSIGYIYVYHWGSFKVQEEFGRAVNLLMHRDNVTGLILDFRFNGGGGADKANAGFAYLFNEDPTYNFYDFVRTPGGGHLDLERCYSGMSGMATFTPTYELFDHPIAVLTGPNCGSWGDMNAFRMRFHPMVRFFGEKTMGAFVSWCNWSSTILHHYNYIYRIDGGSMYSNYNNEGFLIHKGNPVDEEIWLTREAIANGKDNVVERAVQWINSKLYVHDISAGKFKLYEDSVHISAVIANPESHPVTAKAYIYKINNELIDSTWLVKKENSWNGGIKKPVDEDYYKVSVSIFDDKEVFTVPNATRFTTVPLILKNLSCVQVIDRYAVFKPFLTNLSNSDTIENIKVKLTCQDSSVIRIFPEYVVLRNLSPGESDSALTNINVEFNPASFPDISDVHFNFDVSVFSRGWPFWGKDTLLFVGIDDKNSSQIPAEFTLSQNYPNPFNAATLIRYSLPRLSFVSIKIFNALGEEVAAFINKEQSYGQYEFNWNSGILPSGVYYYQLKAGEFTQTKKMVLIK